MHIRLEHLKIFPSFDLAGLNFRVHVSLARDAATNPKRGVRGSWRVPQRTIGITLNLELGSYFNFTIHL